ncbi:gp060 (endogenous virus) [Lactococcus phage KSY1]|uniref:Gp060 n=1 Tax=Lactococcus phage KSY1 TaxID=2913972 RepID=A6MAC5_9CAUD|nr:gp060 [Lactococcus phage KSY1]ABG21603.1 gp060 [Lactococcus phage KSY1]
MSEAISGKYSSTMEYGDVSTEVKVTFNPDIQPFPVDPKNETPSYDNSITNIPLGIPNYGKFLGYGEWLTGVEDEDKTLIDRLVSKDTSFANILSKYMISDNYLVQLRKGLTQYEDVRYGALFDSMLKNNIFVDDMNGHLVNGYNRPGLVKMSISDFIQFLVNMRVWRYNLLDNPLSFRKYMAIVASILGNMQLPIDFPVLIDRLTTVKATNAISASVPYSTSNSDAIGWVTQSSNSGYGTATIQNKVSKTNVRTSQLIANLVRPTGTQDDLLVTPGSRSINITKCGGVTTNVYLGYQLDRVTGTRLASATTYPKEDKPLFGSDVWGKDGSANNEVKDKPKPVTKDYFIVYVMSGYVEHAVIFDCSDPTYKVVEDDITMNFPPDFISLLEPKTKIFRDAYQYYVNEKENTWKTFPIQKMFDSMGKVVEAFTILDCNLDEPRANTIDENSPRINVNYGYNQYFKMYSYAKQATMLNVMPAYGVTFNKAYYYNPRDFLTLQDYDEACIPIHGSFMPSHLRWYQSDVQRPWYSRGRDVYSYNGGYTGGYLGGPGWYGGWWDSLWGVPSLYLGWYSGFFW